MIGQNHLPDNAVDYILDGNTNEKVVGEIAELAKLLLTCQNHIKAALSRDNEKDYLTQILAKHQYILKLGQAIDALSKNNTRIQEMIETLQGAYSRDIRTTNSKVPLLLEALTNSSNGKESLSLKEMLTHYREVVKRLANPSKHDISIYKNIIKKSGEAHKEPYSLVNSASQFFIKSVTATKAPLSE